MKNCPEPMNQYHNVRMRQNIVSAVFLYKGEQLEIEIKNTIIIAMKNIKYLWISLTKICARYV